MKQFLAATNIIDWQHFAILNLAKELAAKKDKTETAKTCFKWVRDNIKHSSDYKMNPVRVIHELPLLLRFGSFKIQNRILFREKSFTRCIVKS